MTALKPPQTATDADAKFMTMALKQMRQAGVVDKTGGPFGAVVVLGGKVLAIAGNSVTRDNDPSAHAEVNAMREACRKVGSPHIDGAVLYSSCEPCPMCYATAYWARVARIVYGASYADYADIFDDSNIADDMLLPLPEAQRGDAAAHAVRGAGRVGGVSQAPRRRPLLASRRDATACVARQLHRHASFLLRDVIPGLVPGIHSSACSAFSRTIDPGNKCRDDDLC
ncbi:MAG: nucleoside deaminase [Hyphomicrobium sp.]